MLEDVAERDFDAATCCLVMHFLPDDGTKLAFLRVNGGWILGQRGGVKAGHFRRGTVVCKKAPDRGPFCKSASALGIKLG
jgi:hypothetical protein